MLHGVRAVLAAGAIACVIAIAGCGPSGGSGGSHPSSTTGAPDRSGNASSLVPENIKSQGTIDIATPSETPPEEFNDSSGKLVGYEIDIINAVAKQLGLKAHLTLTPFASIIPGMQAKRYLLAVGQFGIRLEREAVVDMVSLALLNEGFGVLKSSGITSLTLATLCGHSVATITGSLEQQYASKQSSKCTGSGQKAIELHTYSDDASAWLSVQSGRSQVYWSGSTAVGYAVNSSKTPASVVGTNLEKTPRASWFKREAVSDRQYKRPCRS